LSNKNKDQFSSNIDTRRKTRKKKPGTYPGFKGWKGYLREVLSLNFYNIILIPCKYIIKSSYLLRLHKTVFILTLIYIIFNRLCWRCYTKKKERLVKMKPYIRRRSDFIGSNPISEENDAGIIVIRDGNKYKVAVEMDVDTVVWVDETENRRDLDSLIEGLIDKVPEIREQFAGCRPD